MQTALEMLPAGQSLERTLSTFGMTIEIAPLQTYRSESGQFCRVYMEKITAKGQKRRYPGIACRDAGGRWQLPVDEG